MRPIGNETGAAMSSTAFDLRRRPCRRRCRSLAARRAQMCAARQTAAASARLLDYWRSHAPAAGRRAPACAGCRVRCRATRRRAAADVLPFALGDSRRGNRVSRHARACRGVRARRDALADRRPGCDRVGAPTTCAQSRRCIRCPAVARRRSRARDACCRCDPSLDADEVAAITAAAWRECSGAGAGHSSRRGSICWLSRCRPR